MAVSKDDVVRVVKAGASDEGEKTALLTLADEMPSLWDGLEDEDVLGVLRYVLAKNGIFLTMTLCLFHASVIELQNGKIAMCAWLCSWHWSCMSVAYDSCTLH